MWWNSSWAISNPKRWFCESVALNMPANLENSAVAIGLEKVRFHSNPKERQCQRMFKLPHNFTHLTCQQSNAQNSPSQASTVCEPWNSRYSSWIYKRQRKRRSNCQQPLDHQKQESFIKTSISAILTMTKPLTVCITTNCEKIFKRWEYQTAWPASWEIYIQVRKQQLELDIEKQTGSKSGKGYIKAVYCHPDYLI